jgi:hypothetical protein
MEETSLGRDQTRAGGVVDRASNQAQDLCIFRAYGNRESSLPRRREHRRRGDALSDPVLEPQPDEAGRRQQDRSPLGVRIEFGQPGVHVPAEIDDPEVRPVIQQLRPPPETAGGQDGAVRDSRPADRLVADQRISRILPLAHGPQHDAVGQIGRQILERMHREIDAAIQQGVIDLPGEQGPAADPSQRNIGHHVSGGPDVHSLGCLAGCGEQRAHTLGLPPRKRAASGADANGNAKRCQGSPAAETPPITGSSLSCLAARAAACSPELMAAPSEMPSR